ncbi:restriction endonuclease subunit S [Sedimentitalea nanhaiensis]|uniref:Type I restriction enzyme, S subunit n=1 Tax=Sedimentitalea nanhaiensis TaxID=999627 RepID=A0A1I7CR95_9RHOB|nr:restriction endonuclease subunit S [Sedimentitalea nanhaiensis]SFU01932.1 type I restriction enzyme, S subunit [Sedimentitalea nanhaiensis]
MSWETVPLGELIAPKKGSLVSGPFGSNIGSRFFVAEGVPVIRGNNITKGAQKFIEEGFVYLTEEKASEFPNCVATEDDIIFTAAGSIGQVGLIPKERRYKNYIISNKQIRARLDTEKADPLFVYYWLSSKRMVSYIESQNNGGAVPLLNLGIVRRLPVPLPSKNTQERIAAILSAYDDLIENNRRRIALLEQAARLLYREWFVHFRFSGHETASFKDGLPERWEVKQVKDLLLKVKAKPKVRKDEYEQVGSYPCVDQGQSFVGGFTNNSEAIYRDELPLIVFGDHTRALKYVDFPFARGADGTQIIKSNDDRLSQIQFYFALINVDLSNYAYARHFKFLKDQEIILPDEGTGSHFTEIVQTWFIQMQNLRDQNAQLTAARDLLLPRLMDGRIPVSM